MTKKMHYAEVLASLVDTDIVTANSFQSTIFLPDFFDSETETPESLEELQKELGISIRKFTEYLASYISNAASPFEKVWNISCKEIALSTQISDVSIDSKDFFFLDEKRRNIFKGKIDKGIQLHLFNSFVRLILLSTFFHYLLIKIRSIIVELN